MGTSTGRNALSMVVPYLLVGLAHGFLTSHQEACLFGFVPLKLGKGSSLADHPMPFDEHWTRPNTGTSFSSSELEKSKGVIYRQSVLSNGELSSIWREVSGLLSQLQQESSSIAQHRLGASLHPITSPTVQVFREGSLTRLVRRCTGDDTMILARDIPVQLRSYEKQGASMAWHVDDVLYDPPQVEIVLTLENNSDCATMWKVGERHYSIETDPNSVLLLQAGGPLHCVTSLKQGRRLILKCAYVSSNATYLQGSYTNQFPMTANNHGKSTSTNRSKRKNRKG